MHLDKNLRAYVSLPDDPDTVQVIAVDRIEMITPLPGLKYRLLLASGVTFICEQKLTLCQKGADLRQYT